MHVDFIPPTEEQTVLWSINSNQQRYIFKKKFSSSAVKLLKDHNYVYFTVKFSFYVLSELLPVFFFLMFFLNVLLYSLSLVFCVGVTACLSILKFFCGVLK